MEDFCTAILTITAECNFRRIGRMHISD